MTNQEIINVGQQIYDETNVGANTSNRVGGVIKGIGENLSSLDSQLNGGKTVVYYTSAYLNGFNYIANPLINGKEYKLTVHQTQATWMRFGFAKDNSGTGAYYIHEKSVIGDYEYTFNAPDPTVYPYMVIQKPNTASTMEVSYTSTGLTDTIDDLRNDINTNIDNISVLQGEVNTNTGNIAELKNEVDGGRIVDYYTSQYLSGFNYIANPLTNGVQYTLNIHQIANSWYRFGFSKDNSGTGAYYIHEKNAIGDYEYTFNAPDPTVYPYMVIQKPNTDSFIEISHTSSGIMTEVTALQSNVTTLSAQTNGLDEQLNGIDEQVYYTSAYLSGYNYVENPLVSGREYKLFIHQTQATYMRFGFAKDNSGTGAYYIHEKNIIADYEYTFNAPDPTIYPYMVVQKPNANSTFEIRYIVEGFAESTEVLKEDVDALLGNTFTKTINEQQIHLLSDSYNTGYIPCPMFRNTTYLVSLKLTGHTSTPVVVAHINPSNSEVGRIDFSSGDFASGDYVEFTPTEDVGYLLISFNSTYREPAGASMVLNVGYGEKATVSAIDIKPLNDRKFIMLGDSITQLPRTESTQGGVGIVEWFSHLSGAEVIRGAIGGRRLTRTGTKVTTVSEITEYNIAVSFFDVIGLAEALASGDFSLQRAAYQWLVDNNYSPDAQMIYEVDVLDAIDMSTVDAITIFAGTNDWHNNVSLQTIRDAIDSIVETLLTAYPKLTIYFFTPIVRFQDNNLSNWSDTWQNNAGLTIPQYVDAIMEQAKVNCIPVCDLYHGMGWTRYNVTQYIPIGDGTHPRNGFGELAAKMFGFVNSNWPKVYRTIQADEA